jgi:hypothetical protein
MQDLGWFHLMTKVLNLQDLWWFRVLVTQALGEGFEDKGGEGRRRLLDTFGESLIHVNRLYHTAFGREQRKVPAHMPHMITKSVMAEMQDRWKQGESGAIMMVLNKHESFQLDRRTFCLRIRG